MFRFPRHIVLSSVLFATWICCAPLVAAQAPTQGCQAAWLPTFGGQSGVNNQVFAAVVFDDGSGPALYAGGAFTAAGGIPADHIARWNGSSWSALPGTPGFSVTSIYALGVFDDGSGPALYAGGVFTSIGGTPASNIAKWNGTSWSALGAGLDAPGTVWALAGFDDGSGPELYAAGYFTTAGGAPANYIAKWDGANWSPLGSGVTSLVYALAVYDDGSGPGLFAGGAFTWAGGTLVRDIARWRNSSWSALGSGVFGVVNALTVFDDGSGPRLCAGGSFALAGGVTVHNVAGWNGASWSAFGSGVSSLVQALAVHDDGSGPALFEGGSGSGVSRWTGTGWVALGSAFSGFTRALTDYDAGSGPQLHAFGSISSIGGVGVANAARWDGAVWSPLGSGVDAAVFALASRTEPGGPRLYATGDFVSSGTAQLNHIGCWDGTNWSPLGSGFDSIGRSLAFYDDGGGEALYAGGDFITAGGVVARNLAKWDGSTWSALGAGIQSSGGSVDALLIFDDGSGPALYAGGRFDSAGSAASRNIARWDGSNWSALGDGLGTQAHHVRALAAFDDGSGMALYAGGDFYLVSGAPAGGLARWNGTAWSAVAAGPGTPVMALARYDDGSGLALYASGEFSLASGGFANYVAKWNGANWSALGSGTDGFVLALLPHDDGSGGALYAGGRFLHANGSPASNIARWDGTNWSKLGSGTLDGIYALAHLDAPGGAALIAGGTFGSAPDSGDSFVARWANPAGCGAPGVSACEPGTGGVMPCPCGNPPAVQGRGCDNGSATGGALLAATGIARLTYDSVAFVTRGEGPSATSVVLQGDAFSIGGLVFGQGVRCVAGNLKRLYVRNAVNGSIQVPQGADPSVSARSAALGDPIAPGAHREYGVYYRDPNVLGGCPAGSTFNITQQLDIAWAP